MRFSPNLPAVFLIVFLAIANSHAQNDDKTIRRKQHVTFIDIDLALGEHFGLQKKLKELAKEQADFESKVATQRKAIKSLVEELAQHRPDYLELEKHISKVGAELEARIAVHNKRSARSKADAYYDAYMEITSLVAKFAESNDIAAVINFDSSAIHSGDPDSITRALKRLVVFQRNLDITKLITHRCNQAQSADSKDGPSLR